MNNPLQQHRPLSTATLHRPGQISNVHQLMQHIGHPQHGGHLPVWLKKHVAAQVIAQHGPSGDAIPHPGIPIPMPDPQQQQGQPQGYARGGVIGPNPIQSDFGNSQPPAIHPPPRFEGGPIRPPQQIDNGGVGIQNPPPQPPQGLGNLNIGNAGYQFTSMPPSVAPPATNGLGGLSVPPIPVAPAGAGGANPIQNDFGTNSGVVEPDVPALNKSINPRMMNVGGVVKKNKPTPKKRK